VSTLNTGLTSGNSFRDDVESAQGQTILAAHYPAGESEPVQVVVPAARHVRAVRRALARVPGIAPGPFGPVQSVRGISLFNVTLAAGPSTRSALATIAPLRPAAQAAGGS